MATSKKILCVLGTVYGVGTGLLSNGDGIPLYATCAGISMLEALFLVILLIACHMKNSRLLKIPFAYNEVWWVLCVILTVFLATRMIIIYNNPTDGLDWIVLYVGSITLPCLVCAICIRSYVIIWIKGLMKDLEKQSQSFDAVTETSHILEVAKEENERKQVQMDEVVLLVEELNTENITEVQINTEKVETPGDVDKVNAFNQIEVNLSAHSKDNSVQDSENDQDIELQVMN